MSGLLKLDSINKNNLDGLVRSYGNRLNIYFDFKNTEFIVVSLPDKKSNMRVVYSKHRGVCKTYEEKIEKLHENKMRDYHDVIDLMVKECVNNYICQHTKFSNLTTMICDVVYIPEMKGLCFVTAGYKIGQACAEAIYGSDKSDEVSFVIANSGITNITGDVVKQIAARFILKDIEASSNLGYSYYNKSIGDGMNRKICTSNTKRFGKGERVGSLTALMRNFTEFVPIGFSWSSYTPFWMKSMEFISRIANETILGYDLIDVPNFSYDGRELRNVNSVTYLTTRKRIYDVFGLTFKCYNYKFLNEIMAGLFFYGLLDVNPRSAAVGNGGNSDIINLMKYESLSEDDQEEHEYKIVDDERSRKILSLLISKKYWDTMSGEEFNKSETARHLINILFDLTFDDALYADVESDRSMSSNLFGYV